MPLIASSDAEVFEVHGARFSSYVRPARGSDQLCAWRIEVPAGQKGAPHKPSREEVICCIDGELTIGDRRCAAGTLVVLEHGAVFGPLVAGERGALLFETWAGDPAPVPADKAGYQALLRERGIERLAPPRIIRPASAPGGRDRDPPSYG